MTEFEIIKNYFATATEHRADVIHGIGDDAAIVKVPAHHELVITTDTLIAGQHFPLETLPSDIGYKALAVNLSDLAAMGATPAWVTLAISLPEANHHWLHGFCDGFFPLAKRFEVELIGGDITRGSLAITIQAMGFIHGEKALLRSQAKVDDLIYVTGTLGDAGLALQSLQKKISLNDLYRAPLLQRLNRPTPRVAIGQAIRPIAHAAIDISDGLAADLGHVLRQSKVGACIYVDQLPLSAALKNSLAPEAAIALALTAGDDYELCFTIPPRKRLELTEQLGALHCDYTCIGTITAELGLNLSYQNGTPYHGALQGYQHF